MSVALVQVACSPGVLPRSVITCRRFRVVVIGLPSQQRRVAQPNQMQMAFRYLATHVRNYVFTIILCRESCVVQN